VALKANFYAEWDTPGLLALAETSGCGFVQVVCTTSADTLVERYKRRILTGERHPGHTESEALEDTLTRLVNGRWHALELPGPVITVDTEAPLLAAQIDLIADQVRAALENRV
jgi:hypothetical protein